MPGGAIGMRAMTSLPCGGKPRVPARAESSTGLALGSTHGRGALAACYPASCGAAGGADRASGVTSKLSSAKATGSSASRRFEQAASPCGYLPNNRVGFARCPRSLATRSITLLDARPVGVDAVANPLAGIRSRPELEAVEGQKLLDGPACAEGLLFAPVGEEVVAGDGHVVRHLYGPSHPRKGRALRSLDVHLEQVDAIQAEPLHDAVQGEARDGLPTPGCREMVGLIVVGIRNEHVAVRRAHGGVHSEHVVQPVQPAHLLQAAKHKGVSLDCDHQAGRPDLPGEGECVTAAARAHIHDNITGARSIGVHEVVTGEPPQRGDGPEADARLDEATVGVPVNPYAVAVSDPARAPVPRALQQAPQQREKESEAAPVHCLEHTMSECHMSSPRWDWSLGSLARTWVKGQGEGHQLAR